MNIVERGRAFLASLRELAGRSAWDWRCCPNCGSTLTIKNGSYQRRPWFLKGRKTVRVQRHLCHSCRVSYSERSALLVRGSWYAREVHRAAIDHWHLVDLRVPRGLSTERLRERLVGAGVAPQHIDLHADAAAAWTSATAGLQQEDRLLAFGSFWLIGDLIRLSEERDNGPQTDKNPAT